MMYDNCSGLLKVPLTLDGFESIGVFNKIETKMLVLKIRMTLQEYGVDVSMCQPYS